jgi:hypothetical protein
MSGDCKACFLCGKNSVHMTKFSNWKDEPKVFVMRHLITCENITNKDDNNENDSESDTCSEYSTSYSDNDLEDIETEIITDINDSTNVY